MATIYLVFLKNKNTRINIYQNKYKAICKVTRHV